MLAQMSVQSAVCEGRAYYWLGEADLASNLPEARLLAGFDPLMLGYRKEDNPFLPPEHLRGIFNLVGGLSVNGRKRTARSNSLPLSPSVLRISTA